MPRSPKEDQVRSDVLTRAQLISTENPITGVHQDVAALMLQVHEIVENLAPANFGEGKCHERSLSSTHYFLRDQVFKDVQKSTSS